MTYMLCRNRVLDFSRWRAVFSSHEHDHRNAGLNLVRLMVENGTNVFFMFEVANMEKARAFISAPDAAKAAEASGVIDGEYHFVEDAGGYGGTTKNLIGQAK
ncbi:MAG: hypothetical protein WAK13_16065 [Terriglobales bacterium]